MESKVVCVSPSFLSPLNPFCIPAGLSEGWQSRGWVGDAPTPGCLWLFLRDWGSGAPPSTITHTHTHTRKLTYPVHFLCLSFPHLSGIGVQTLRWQKPTPICIQSFPSAGKFGVMRHREWEERGFRPYPCPRGSAIPCQVPREGPGALLLPCSSLAFPFAPRSRS